MTRFSVLWLTCATLLAPLLWGLISASVGTFIVGPGTGLLSNAVDAATWAVITMPLWLPPYAVALLLWPKFVASFPVAERELHNIVGSTAALACPLAIITGVSYAPRYHFPGPFAAAFLSAWLALLLPRAAFPVLRAGAFLRPGQLGRPRDRGSIFTT
jgi:hypothetical protein